MNDPILALLILSLDPSAGQVDADASTQAVIIHEEAFDHFASVAQRNVKLLRSVVGTVLQNMPENRPASDFDHGLGLDFGFFGQSRAQATGKNDDFHWTTVSQSVLSTS